MGNYPYILAGLPPLPADWNSLQATQDAGTRDWNALVREVEAAMPEKDRPWLRLLRLGLTAPCLHARFYALTAQVPCPFLQQYFAFDMDMRNLVAAHIARYHGRDVRSVLVGQSPLTQFITTHSFEELRVARLSGDLPRKLDAILSLDNLLERERRLDGLRWQKAEEISLHHTLDINVLLAQLLKARLVARWRSFDPEAGAQLFRQYVDEIQSSYPKA